MRGGDGRYHLTKKAGRDELIDGIRYIILKDKII